jgi:hypothetical protein
MNILKRFLGARDSKSYEAVQSLRFQLFFAALHRCICLRPLALRMVAISSFQFQALLQSVIFLKVDSV